MAHLIEYFDRERKSVVPRLADGSTPLFLYRIMSRGEFDRGTSAKTFRSRDGRIHAAAVPLLQHCEPGDGNVLVKIAFESNDGWRAKSTMDGVVAIVDQLPAIRVTKIAEGNRTQIEAALARLRIEAAAVYSMDGLSINALNGARGEKHPTTTERLYRFEVMRDGRQVATFGMIFKGDPKTAYFSIDGAGPGALGTTGMRTLWRLIRQRFPRVEKVTGFRATGARRAAGRTSHIEMNITRADTQPVVKLEPKGRETGKNFQDGKYVLYQFAIMLDGKEVAELAVKFSGGDRENAKVNVFGNAKNRLGTRGMRTVFKLVRKRFPALKSIYGERISGARAKAGHAGRTAHFNLTQARLNSLFEVMSKPTDDLKRIRQGRLLWAEVTKRVKKFISDRARRKVITNKDYVNFQGITYQNLPVPQRALPYKHMGHDIFIIQMEGLVGRGHKWENAVIVMNVVQQQRLDASGVFYERGLWGMPTIMVNVWIPGYGTNGLTLDRPDFKPEFFTEFAKRLDKADAWAKTFTHEFSHYLDSLTAHAKTPEIRDENGQVKRPGGDRSRYTQPEDDYVEYINHHKEVNSRYMEWIDGIIKSFERLIAVKRDGVKARFPDFHSFWNYYWMESGYAPDNLRINADESTKRRLARRLAKFYDYVTESGFRPAPFDMKRFAAKQLDEDQKFTGRDKLYEEAALADIVFEKQTPRFIADLSTEIPAGLYDAFGPSVGERPDEWSRNQEFEKTIFAPPKAPKPATKDAAAVTTRGGRFQKKDSAAPPAEDEDEDENTKADDAQPSDEDENADESPQPKGGKKAGGKKKGPAPASKGPRPKMRELRANYRRPA